MNDYDFDSSGFVFTEALRDVEAEQRAEHLIRGKLAAAGFWPYLAEAASEAEFGHRLALVEDRLAQLVPPAVLEPVQASLAADWKLLHTARLEEHRTAAQERGERIREHTARARSEQLQPEQEFYDQQAGRWVTVAQLVPGPVGMPDLMDAYRSRTADLANPEQYVPGVGWQVSAANSASGYTLPSRYKLPEDLRDNQHATEGYRDARYHAANDYDWRLADGDSFTLQHQDYQQGYSRAHDDLKAGSRHGKQAYLDPSDAQRYSAYPDLNPPVDNGPLQGPDGFVTDPQPDNTGASNAVIQQRQLTPGQWTVTPGSEWPVRPNAGDPSQTPRTASRRQANTVIPEAWRRGNAPSHWVLHDDRGGIERSVTHAEMAPGVVSALSGNQDPHARIELDDSDNPQTIWVHRNGEAVPWRAHYQQRQSSHRQAGEGIVPTPGPNPNYFSQGSDGLAGPPSFPENPSGQIEPKTDNRIDDLYGAVPPQVSPGSAVGQADGQGYSRQAPGSSATAGRRPFDRTAVGNVDSQGWFTTRRAGYPKAETDCGHKFFDNTGRCKDCGYSAADEQNHEDWVRDTFGDKGAERADALLGDNHIGPTRYSSRTASETHPAEDLRPGDSYDGPGGVRVHILGGQEPHEDQFGRSQFKYRARRADTGAEGYVIFGPGGVVTGHSRGTKEASRHISAFDDSHVTHYVGWARSQGKNPDDVETLKTYEKQPGIGRSHTNFLADQLYIGGGDSNWRRQAALGEGDIRRIQDAAIRHPDLEDKHCGPGGISGASGRQLQAMVEEAERRDQGDWGPGYTAARLAVTDGRIVGHCDHCRNPVRYHTNENGVDELRHLHNNDNRCSNGQQATAKLNRVHAFYDPADPGVIVVTADETRNRPTLDHPAGVPDEFDANTWDNALTQRPLQSAEDRHINTPTQARDPIPTIESTPRDNDLDENRNQNPMARETSLHEIMEMS